MSSSEPRWALLSSNIFKGFIFCLLSLYEPNKLPIAHFCPIKPYWAFWVHMQIILHKTSKNLGWNRQWTENEMRINLEQNLRTESLEGTGLMVSTFIPLNCFLVPSISYKALTKVFMGFSKFAWFSSKFPRDDLSQVFPKWLTPRAQLIKHSNLIAGDWRYKQCSMWELSSSLSSLLVSIGTGNHNM